MHPAVLRAILLVGVLVTFAITDNPFVILSSAMFAGAVIAYRNSLAYTALFAVACAALLVKEYAYVAAQSLKMVSFFFPGEDMGPVGEVILIVSLVFAGGIFVWVCDSSMETSEEEQESKKQVA